MVPFLLMLGAFALLHLPGLRRWPGGPAPWQKAAGAMGLVLLLTAWVHFRVPDRFVAMVPPSLPWPAGLVFASGLAELGVGLGLLVPRTRRMAGWIGIALLIAIWPANVHAALSGNALPGGSSSSVYLWLRVPFQLLYIGWAGWVALGHLPGRGLRQRLMARIYDKVMARYEVWAAPRRQALFAGLSGTVVELGPGTGATLPFLDPGVTWIGIEPNVHMHAALRARAAACGIAKATFRTVSAEGLDLPSESADVVISSLVLCSVDDPVGVIREVLRVLKPGGRFVFMEHVAAPRGTGRRRLQRVIRPVWTCVADGCRPDRETGVLIERAGFESVEIERFDVPKEAVARFVAPHVSGHARKVRVR